MTQKPRIQFQSGDFVRVRYCGCGGRLQKGRFRKRRKNLRFLRDCRICIAFRKRKLHENGRSEFRYRFNHGADDGKDEICRVWRGIVRFRRCETNVDHAGTGRL